MAENTTINMTFEGENEDPNQPKSDAQSLPPAVVEDEPGFIKKAIGVVTFPIRWAWGKVKDSPASAAIGMVVGAGVGLGAKAAIDHFGKKDSFIPADTDHIEIPDDGEEYSSVSSENAEN